MCHPCCFFFLWGGGVRWERRRCKLAKKNPLYRLTLLNIQVCVNSPAPVRLSCSWKHLTGPTPVGISTLGWVLEVAERSGLIWTVGLLEVGTVVEIRSCHLLGFDRVQAHWGSMKAQLAVTGLKVRHRGFDTNEHDASCITGYLVCRRLRVGAWLFLHFLTEKMWQRQGIEEKPDALFWVPTL